MSPSRSDPGRPERAAAAKSVSALAEKPVVIALAVPTVDWLVCYFYPPHYHSADKAREHLPGCACIARICLERRKAFGTCPSKLK